MPNPMTDEKRKARAEKRAARLAIFAQAPLHQARRRLTDCADPDTFEPNAEFTQDEARALLAHLTRLECRYRVLFDLVNHDRAMSTRLGSIEGAMAETDAFNPDRASNWGGV